jgi:hypothetical protein
LATNQGVVGSIPASRARIQRVSVKTLTRFSFVWDFGVTRK